MMTALKTVIDLHDMKLHMKEYGITIPMFALPSGHVTVEIMGFENGRFQVPEGAPGCKQQDFELSHGDEIHVIECNMAAMVAQEKNHRNSSPTFSTSSLGE